MDGWMHGCMDVWMYGCMYVIHPCMYVCMYVCYPLFYFISLYLLYEPATNTVAR